MVGFVSAQHKGAGYKQHPQVPLLSSPNACTIPQATKQRQQTNKQILKTQNIVDVSTGWASWDTGQSEEGWRVYQDRQIEKIEHNHNHFPDPNLLFHVDNLLISTPACPETKTKQKRR